MRRMTAITAAVCMMVVGALTMTVKAQDFNALEKTFLTFSAPFEVPGMTLPAGIYTFKLADTPGRNVVQVMSQDEKTIHGQFLFVPAVRRDATGDTVVTFRETAEGTTPAVHYWYYPGETIGKEFIYPKEQALRIATRTNSTVLSTEGQISAAPSAPVQQAAVAPPVQPTVAAPVEQPRNEVVSNTAVGTSGAQAETQVAALELPRTASPLALSGLLGLLALAGGLGLRVVRQ